MFYELWLKVYRLLHLHKLRIVSCIYTKNKRKETCNCKTNTGELCIPARTVGDVELLGGCYTVNEGTEGLLSWWQKKKDNVVAFYSHTIDRCLITKEEKKKLVFCDRKVGYASCFSSYETRAIIHVQFCKFFLFKS